MPFFLHLSFFHIINHPCFGINFFCTYLFKFCNKLLLTIFSIPINNYYSRLLLSKISGYYRDILSFIFSEKIIQELCLIYIMKLIVFELFSYCVRLLTILILYNFFDVYITKKDFIFAHNIKCYRIYNKSN